ncbi:Helix-turn-helix domain protein [compost metagenome]
MSTLTRRIKEARLQAGLSQEELGIRIGIDPASASTRMNRYELGRRVPHLEVVERLAEELRFPVAFFYAAEDDEADLLVKYSKLSIDQQKMLISYLNSLLS